MEKEKDCNEDYTQGSKLVMLNWVATTWVLILCTYLYV